MIKLSAPMSIGLLGFCLGILVGLGIGVLFPQEDMSAGRMVLVIGGAGALAFFLPLSGIFDRRRR